MCLCHVRVQVAEGVKRVGLVAAVSKAYPGRASASSHLDLLMTLLYLGAEGWAQVGKIVARYHRVSTGRHGSETQRALDVASVFRRQRGLAPPDGASHST
jgi:hypothetical protein